MNQKNILIIGAGVIGQVYGAHLIEAGHKVTFLVREKYREQFIKKGITIHCEGSIFPYSCSQNLEIKDAAFITNMPELSDIDYIFVTTRAEQRQEIAEMLEKCDLSYNKKTELVICFPFFRRGTYFYF